MSNDLNLNEKTTRNTFFCFSIYVFYVDFVQCSSRRYITLSRIFLGLKHKPMIVCCKETVLAPISAFYSQIQKNIIDSHSSRIADMYMYNVWIVSWSQKNAKLLNRLKYIEIELLYWKEVDKKLNVQLNSIALTTQNLTFVYILYKKYVVLAVFLFLLCYFLSITGSNGCQLSSNLNLFTNS